MIENTCGTCQYFQPEAEECRYNPPQVVFLKDDMTYLDLPKATVYILPYPGATAEELTQISAWPKVDPGGYGCGQWK